MKKLTFIRHGESELNANLVPFNSENIDCLLTQNGIDQAKTLTGAYDLVILSDYRRAMLTYCYSKISAKDVIICDLFGEFLLKEDIEDCKNEDLLKIAETEDEIEARIDAAITILKNSKAENICVIAHHNLILAILINFGIMQQTIGNCQSIHVDVQ